MDNTDQAIDQKPTEPKELKESKEPPSYDEIKQAMWVEYTKTCFVSLLDLNMQKIKFVRF